MPPKWVSTMSQVHKYQCVNGPSYDTVSEAFRWFSLLLALGIIVTVLLGMVMAFPVKKSAMAVGHRHAAAAHRLSLVRQQLTRPDDFGFRFLTSALDWFRTREPSNVVIPFF